MEKQRRKGTYLFLTFWELDTPGGVNQVVLNLYRIAQASRRYRPLSLVTDWTRRTPWLGRLKGRATLRTFQRTPWDRKKKSWTLFVYLVTLPWNLVLATVLMRQLSVEVVNIHFPTLEAMTWVLMRHFGLFRGKIVFSLHGREVRDAGMTRGTERMLWNWMLGHTDEIVSCSQGLADDTLALFPSVRPSLSVIHNGVNAEVLQARAHVDVPGNSAATKRPLLVNLGTFEHKKGQDVLLAAFAIVLERIPDATLVIAGRTGDAEVYRQLESGITRLKLQGNVSLLRDLRHEQAIALLASCDLFVLPSRNEGFAIALLEAGALTRPVVATNVCGVAELIANGEDGVIVPPDDVRSLADAICAELLDPSASQAKARRLQKKVTTQYTWERAWREYEELAAADGNARLVATSPAPAARAERDAP